MFAGLDDFCVEESDFGDHVWWGGDRDDDGAGALEGECSVCAGEAGVAAGGTVEVDLGAGICGEGAEE